MSQAAHARGTCNLQYLVPSRSMMWKPWGEWGEGRGKCYAQGWAFMQKDCIWQKPGLSWAHGMIHDL